MIRRDYTSEGYKEEDSTLKSDIINTLFKAINSITDEMKRSKDENVKMKQDMNKTLE